MTSDDGERKSVHREVTRTPGEIVTLACVLEVSAPKPGNVHRGADFEDVGLVDFLVSGVSLGQVVDQLSDRTAGDCVLAAVERTQVLVGSNTNLGMILLLVPLAKVAAKSESGGTEFNVESMKGWLAELDSSDGDKVFEAIRLARPGGLGASNEMDVRDSTKEAESKVDLIAAMRLAKDRDLIALQYVNGFEQVFDVVVPLLIEGAERLGSLQSGIVFAHLALMSWFPDSLIARKCGKDVAEQSAHMAEEAICKLNDSEEQFWTAVGDLDFWLRSDGHRRNPGTSADMIAAGLFVALWNRAIEPPFR